MVPTYRPTEYLVRTLESVLTQDPGASEMQIMVVDDGSPEPVAEMVERAGKGRVEFRRNAARRGLFGNWNACVGLAAGEYVHLLHQDDLALPGFYSEMGTVLDQNPGALAAFCRHLYIDANDVWRLMSAVEQDEAGILKEWRKRFAKGISLQCPAVVVRKSAYERVGLYSEAYRYAADVDMWLRLAAAGPVAFTPRVLAAWRMHAASASRECIERQDDVTEGLTLIDVAERLFPDCPDELRVRECMAMGDIMRGLRSLLEAGRWREGRERIAILSGASVESPRRQSALLKAWLLFTLFRLLSKSGRGRQ
jgi:hypothetical protein